MIRQILCAAVAVALLTCPALAADACVAPAPPALPAASAPDPDGATAHQAMVNQDSFVAGSQDYRACLQSSGDGDAQARIDASNADEQRVSQDFETWQSAYAAAHQSN